VVYDNFTYEYRSAAVLNIEKAVRLSWPALATAFAVEAAPTVNGPWTLLTEPIIQRDGLNYVTVPAPASEAMSVFRLQKVSSP